MEFSNFICMCLLALMLSYAISAGVIMTNDSKEISSVVESVYVENSMNKTPIKLDKLYYFQKRANGYVYKAVRLEEENKLVSKSKDYVIKEILDNNKCVVQEYTADNLVKWKGTEYILLQRGVLLNE